MREEGVSPFPTTSTITILFLEKTKIYIHMVAVRTWLLMGSLVPFFILNFLNYYLFNKHTA